MDVNVNLNFYKRIYMIKHGEGKRSTDIGTGTRMASRRRAIHGTMI